MIIRSKLIDYNGVLYIYEFFLYFSSDYGNYEEKMGFLKIGVGKLII